jgi:hypothetical protein
VLQVRGIHRTNKASCAGSGNQTGWDGIIFQYFDYSNMCKSMEGTSAKTLPALFTNPDSGKKNDVDIIRFMMHKNIT